MSKQTLLRGTVLAAMSLTTSLSKAKKQKNDEFYTQLPDIENELRHYTEHFRGKVVYCNCDDPRVSKFFHFFSYNFERLGLKKLIAACYKNQERDLFSRHDSERAIWLEYKGNTKGGRVPDVGDIGISEFAGDGDFRNSEGIELLNQADIVVTNPPFSLFREYVAQLVEYDKKFLIIGSQNAIGYKEIFPLIKDSRLWLGYGFKSGNAYFKTNANEHYASKSYFDKTTGLVKFRNVCWFTNLDHAKRHEELILYKRYSPEEYPKYDNYDAINVDKIAEIPMDWDGVMGVPITFLNKHNPGQFEIVGITKTWFGAATKTYLPQVQVSMSGKRSEVTKLNDGAALQIDGPIEKTHYMVDGKHYVQAYARILIRGMNFRQ